MTVRRMISFILVVVSLVCMLCISPVSAGALTSGEYEYEMYSEDTAMITKYNGGEKKNLVIPSTINGYKVSGICSYAFENTQAEKITLPDTLEFIDFMAFYNISAKTIHIPKNVMYVGAVPFCGLDLEKITVDKNNKSIKDVDGVLFTKDGTVLLSYPCGRKNKEYKIPEGVEGIYNAAFFCSFALEKVTMPEGLEVIYPEAFVACEGITDIEIPSTVMYVGEKAFFQCSSLKKISVPGGEIYYIASDAFDETYWKTNHPGGVLYLGTMAYAYNRRAQVGEVADIKEGTTMICEKAFASHESPYHINIPASVNYIDFTAFLEPYHLETINVHEDNENFCSVDGILYSKDKTVLYTYPGAKKQDSITVSEGVEVIWEDAFRNCKLSEIICPDSLVAIGDHAFMGCRSLERIVFKGNLTHVGIELLKDSRNVEEIIFPEGSALFSYEDFEDTFLYRSKFYDEYVYLNGCVFGYKGSSESKVLNLPEGAISVGERAFADDSSLIHVRLPESLKKIGPCAFENCPRLKMITIPASVDEIYPFSLGYTYVEGETKYDGEHFPVEGFLIRGYTNSAAEVYALENGFDFESIGVLSVSELLGDTDLDGKISIKDATAIQKYLASIKGFCTQQKENADMNGDDAVNIKDATAIQKHLAGLPY